MNKKFKKICIMALTFAITATSVISMSLSADCVCFDTNLSGYTVLDDKGMLKYDDRDSECYKILYRDGGLFRAHPSSYCAQFILSEDVDYEKANERVMEIFKEFYSGKYLAVSFPSLDYYDEYEGNYKPVLESYTVDGVTTYTLHANIMNSLKDEKLEEAAAKHCKDFMKKLNEEKLISAFYGFGETYFAFINTPCVGYSADVDIDLINNYIKENNIDFTIEKNEDSYFYYYILKSNNGDVNGDVLEEFLAAVDIYEATSIKITPINMAESGLPITVNGKNSLEDLWSIGDANGDEKINIKDCLFIARKLANREGAKLPDSADYNKDGKKNIKDAAALAMDIAKRNIG